MAKTLKDFLNERKQLGPMKVKNPDEQKFIDKHVVATIPDRNGNDDELFKGSKVKFSDRPPHRKGYNPGEDEEVYEAAVKLTPGWGDGGKSMKANYGKLTGNQHKLDHNKNGKLDAHDFHLMRKKKKVAEEAEQIDELSQDKLMAYRSAAKKQGTGIQDKMKVGGGDWSKDGKDTKTLKKRMSGYKMAGRKVNPGLAATVGKAPRIAANEETEQLDELSPSTMGSYTKKAAADFAARKPKMGYDGQLKKMQNRKVGVDRALKKIYGEEAEQIDELSQNTMARYVNKAAGERDKYHADRNKTAEGARKYFNRKNGVRKAIEKTTEEAELEEKLNMDKASMGDVIKDFQDSDAPQFKGKSDKKRRVMAIAAKLSAERGGKPLNKEERLLSKLGDLSESYQRTMVSVFNKLNEDNQRSFMAACDTPEGVEQMLDFAIQNRGE